MGEIKNWFTDIVDTYIPGESGAIAKAMTIGDKSEISDTTIDYFNYAGTSHLLVISGLHLTLWSIGIMRFIEKSSKLRKYTVIIGFACLLGYSALTGFSVSVIRAGAMIGAVLDGKLLTEAEAKCFMSDYPVFSWMDSDGFTKTVKASTTIFKISNIIV